MINWHNNQIARDDNYAVIILIILGKHNFKTEKQDFYMDGDYCQMSYCKWTSFFFSKYMNIV